MSNETLFADFLDSIDKVKEKNVLMHHSPLEVRQASKLFPGYLTDEELQEHQYIGRFWDVICNFLYILVDNETLVIVRPNGTVEIADRKTEWCKVPDNLRGRHYYDEH